jgi:uncharacterized protein YndB with AHSA1/START domain
MNHSPLIVERTCNAPVEQVWKAITDNQSMKQWYFELEDFRPEVGFTFSFVGENEGRKFIHLCRITEVVPNRKLSYTWQYEGLDALTVVTFELFPEQGGTRLKLTHEGLENLPQDRDYARSNFEAGWDHIINKSLSGFLGEKVEG